MTRRRDPDTLIHQFLLEGSERLPDPIYDEVRSEIDRTPQRAVIGPWRTTVDMNKLLAYGLGAAAVVAVLFIGIQLLGPPAQGGVGASPSAAGTSVSGVVEYQLDFLDTTTTVEAVADGATVSGTAVTRSDNGIHRVRLECAARDGDTWALGGTIEETTYPDEEPGNWSAVVVREASSQYVGIWLSDSKVEGVDCEGWLRGVGLSGIDDANFAPIDSGELEAPPDLAG